MKLISQSIILLLLSIVIGCSTPYAKDGFMGGFTETKLDSVTYRVAFRGNGMTSRETVVKYMLYRCAELTTEAGYKYFEISFEGANTNTNASQVYDVNTNSTRSSVIVKHDAEATIVLLKEKPEKIKENIYNAKQYMSVNKIN
ncbi:MAG: hypothetical protein KIT50_13505 [Bacteroidetes bacterium]|nr:hypothetical protein [Bacteroidota bacterium]